MGILNATPDSFHASSRVEGTDAALRMAEKHIREGASILDIGGYSTRPGAQAVEEEEELKRLLPLVEKISSSFPDTPLSVDTFRARVAREAVMAGANIVNDIAAGNEDSAMLQTVAELKVPYIAMHMPGTAHTTHANPQYNDVASDVFHYLAEKIHACREAGITDVIIDPGFGFGKTAAHNFELLQKLHVLTHLDAPLLIGISRKGMVWKTLGIASTEALNGSTVLHTLALVQGAGILRVHDTKEAMECIRLVEAYRAQ